MGDEFGAGRSLTLNFGAAGVEVDSADADLGTPTHTVVLASSVGFSDSYQRVIEETLLNTPWSGGHNNPAVRSDIVLLRMPTWRPRFQRWIDRMDRDPVGLRIPIGHVAHHRQRATNLLELSHCVPSSSGSYPTGKTVELSTDGWRITAPNASNSRVRSFSPAGCFEFRRYHCMRRGSRHRSK